MDTGNSLQQRECIAYAYFCFVAEVCEHAPTGNQVRLTHTAKVVLLIRASQISSGPSVFFLNHALRGGGLLTP
jgi:hypothetical protein